MDAWTTDFLAALDPASSEIGEWVSHCATATSARPSGRWTKRAATLIEAIGVERVRELIVNAGAGVGKAHSEMSPDDRYLCIVPGRSSAKKATGPVMLPFEGDEILSIILSKAFMLVDESKISDPTILSQIR